LGIDRVAIDGELGSAEVKHDAAKNESAVMALNISAWSIRRPLTSVVLSSMLLLLGWASFMRLPVTRLPAADIPVISVVVTQFGAGPSELEVQVTKFIEDSVSGVEGVRHITSQISDGMSVTTIEFRLETNTDRALNDVKDAVTRTRSNLPRNIDGEPLVQRLDVVALPIVTYAAISPGKTPERLSWFVDDVVQRRLQGVRGVAQVERIGGVDREILVSLDPDRLQAVGLTAADVSKLLRGTNVDVASGRAEIGGRDQVIRTLAAAKSLNQLSGLMIGLPRGGAVRLEDLGVVTDTVATPSIFARYNGDPIVAFGIWRSKGQSDVVVAAAVQNKIDEIKDAYPDVELRPIDNTVDFTLGNYESAIHTLFEGAALAVIIVFLFLRDVRATIIAAVSLPLSIFPAFWALDILGFSLNLVSFLAITLSTGILVDDAIVEIENIVRHMRMGKSPYQAAIDAADEIGLAVIAISLTIVAMFVPASFMPGIAGQFFKQFGITVSVQVLFSLLAARLITPMLAAYFLRHHTIVERPPGFVMRAYTRLVTWSVRHYLTTVLIGLMLFAASIWSMGLLSKGFLPDQDESKSRLAIELPPGSRLSDTERVTEEIVKKLRLRPEVTSVFVDGGRVPKASKEVRRASLYINYTAKNKRSITQRDLEIAIGRELDDIPDMRYWFADESGLRAITLDVTGPDSATVTNVAEELAAQMRQIPLVANVVSQTALERPELRIRPRTDMLARLGVSTEGLSETIRVATIGDVGPALARFDTGDRLVPIRVQLEEKARTNLQIIEQLRVPTAGGGGVPLGAIADISLDQGPINIDRFDRNRRAVLSADLAGQSSLETAMSAIYALPVMKSHPKGVSFSESGDAENMADLFDGFANAMKFGLMMVYAVLVLLFGSFLQPITILFSLPLSIGGAIIALLLAGMQLTVPVSIGILMLMGIVTKNAIMLVDFAIESIHGGMERAAAIIDAGQKRARPIVMTTIAMIAGMIPSALAFGDGGEFRAPMAYAVIGGLLCSTALSLVFVPAMFVLMDNVSRVSSSLGSRFVSKSEPEAGRRV
jgi:hydrophobe/amphiphile efflux-1 (HAE1) family protein